MRDFLIYALYRLFGVLMGSLPPRMGYKLARRAGALLYALAPKLRRVIRHNLRHVLGPDASEEKLEAIVREACANIAKGHYDLFRLSRLTADEIRAMTRVEGLERMKQVISQGKGAIVVTAHLGNVDIMGQIPAQYGVPMMGPVEHVKPEKLFQYTLQLRQKHGLRLIPADGPLMEMFRALKRGEIVGLPCDRGFADNAREVEFFGAPARLPEGPVRVALRTGAPLLPAFASRLPDDSFLIQVEPPLTLERTEDTEADVGAGMAQIARILEKHISAHPEQWLVAVPVWPME